MRLIDLRHDFVLRHLETQDWQYVSRITGIEAAAMKVHFAAYLKGKTVSTKACRTGEAALDEFALWKLLQAERLTPAGVTLWLTWQLGLRLEEIVPLRWDQLQGEILHLENREVPLTSGVLGVLADLRAEAPGKEYILTAPRSCLLYTSYATYYIQTMAAQGIISGYNDGSFKPQANITRGQMAKILYNLM